MSSSLLPLILSYYSLSSQKDTFSQLIHTGHSHSSFTQLKSHRSSHTEHPIDATFSFPSTQTQQDHTHHTTHSSSNEVFSVSSSSSSMRQDNTRHDKTWHDKMIDLSKNDDKNTSGNDKVRIKSPYFLQKSYFIWQNNTKVLIVQYMSNRCPICIQYPKNTYVLLITNDLSQGERMNTITSLPSRLEFICHFCAQDVEDTPDMMMASSSIVQSTSPITPYLIWLITTYHSSHMTHHYSWLSQMTYHQ